jgi:tetratricopeptide (TPR) repeat protein
VTTAHQILSFARAAGEKLPGVEASTLFAAAMRLAVDQGHAPRPEELHIDDAGVLTLVREEAGSLPAAYLAPEMSGDDPPRRSEPRVQVYAAGALGYELLAGRQPPPPPAVPGAEVQGLLGDLVKVALAADRRERFGDLRQLLDAVEGVHPRRSREVEQKLLAGLVRRARDWRGKAPALQAEDAGRALRELSARIDALEGSLKPVRVLWARADSLEMSLQTLREQQESALRRVSAPPETAGAEPGKVFAIALFAAVLVVLATGGALFALRGSLAPLWRSLAAGVSQGGNAARDAEAGALPRAEAAPEGGTVTALARAVARSQVSLGEKALESGNARAAVVSFRTALAGQADLAEAVRGLGRAYAMQGKDAEARVEYERYLALAPEAADAADIRKAIRDLEESGRAAGKKTR